MSDVNGSTDFAFLEGTWNIANKRRQVNLLTTDPQTNKAHDWQEFPARHTGQVLIENKVLLDRYEATFPSGFQLIGITVRAYDEATGLWSLIWLDNRQPPDFRPLMGQFKDGIGIFEQVIETPDGRPLHVKFTWDNLSENTARWQQAFSVDDGQTWDTNWVMDFSR
jgi:hypothetical protein